jgi:fructokinase
MYRNGKGRPVIFGEMLFDRYKDGRSMPGGAPFNVAWHLRGFGLEPILISRVGRDSAGDELLGFMQSWGMDTTAVQIDDEMPTGASDVELVSGNPFYHLLPRQAYDYIGAAAMFSALDDVTPALLYHGTLASRCSVSAAALAAVRAAIPSVFVDINLRQPWCERKRVEPLLRGVHWLKCNEAELSVVARGIGIAGESGQIAAKVRAHYGAKLLIVTRGERGACLYADTGDTCGEAAISCDLADTVGAGDAFSAVSILGLMKKWPTDLILARALEFSAKICCTHGATVADADFYREIGTAWGMWDSGCVL